MFGRIVLLLYSVNISIPNGNKQIKFSCFFGYFPNIHRITRFLCADFPPSKLNCGSSIKKLKNHNDFSVFVRLERSFAHFALANFLLVTNVIAWQLFSIEMMKDWRHFEAWKSAADIAAKWEISCWSKLSHFHGVGLWRFCFFFSSCHDTIYGWRGNFSLVFIGFHVSFFNGFLIVFIEMNSQMRTLPNTQTEMCTNWIELNNWRVTSEMTKESFFFLYEQNYFVSLNFSIKTIKTF